MVHFTMMAVTLYNMPKKSKEFRKGRGLNSKNKYKCQCGQRVITKNGPTRVHGFVCHKTNMFVSILDTKGNYFNKEKVKCHSKTSTPNNH